MPREVAVLGVDDNDVICENQSVPISSVRHDLEQVGYTGAELLNRMMEKKKTARVILIPPKGVTTRRSTETTAVADPQLATALGIIERRIREPLGAAQIADEMGIPRIRLDRLFARELGTSVGREILRQRMINAKFLLRDTKMNLTEIAAHTGFCNAGYLANVFRREFGTTPGRYRASTEA